MITKRILFMFPPKAAELPIVTHLVRDYDLDVNIFRALVNQKEEGFMMVDLTGTEENIRRGLDFAARQEIQISENQLGMQWNRDRCTACGNCLTHCPTEALHIPDRSTMLVDYDTTRCVECMNCIENCPFGACSSLF